MEKEQFQIRVVEYLSGTLEDSESVLFEQFLANHPEQMEEFQEIQLAWKQLDSLERPETSENMDAKFYDMLHNQMQLNEKDPKSFSSRFPTILEQLWRPQLAYGILLLGVGLGLGYFMNAENSIAAVRTEIVDNSETEEVREKLVLTLLEQPSANKRLQAVSEATKLNSATERVINALFKTLNNDPNINVRLAAIGSLERYVEKPEVRMGFIQSIGNQASPLVQIALADLMVKLQEKSSVDSMKQLLEQPDIDTTVKQKIEESINHII